jgi:hypothetical protein
MTPRVGSNTVATCTTEPRRFKRENVAEKTGRALERVKYRVDFDEGMHVVSQLVKKDWQVVSSHKKFRDAIKALNELRGIKK